MNSNEYMRLYMQERYKQRMEYCRAYLGDKCSECGAIDNIEFHHLDTSTKAFTISTGAYRMSLEKLNLELDKCVLLCDTCHKVRHEAKHGTLSVQGCKCDLCKEAKRVWNKEYNARTRTISSIG